MSRIMYAESVPDFESSKWSKSDGENGKMAIGFRWGATGPLQPMVYEEFILDPWILEGNLAQGGDGGNGLEM